MSGYTQKKFRTGFAMALLTALLLCAPSASAEPLRVAVPDLAPYGFLDKNHRPAGTFMELANAIVTESGFEPEIIVLPQEKIASAMEAGKVEGAILFPGPEIGSMAENLGELLSIDVVAVGNAGTVLRTRRDLGGKRVAVVKSCDCDGGLSRKDGVTPLPASNFTRALKLLLARQVGAIVGPWPCILAAVEGMNRSKRILGDPLTLSHIGVHFFLSSESGIRDGRKRLKGGLTRLQGNGTIEKIIINQTIRTL